MAFNIENFSAQFDGDYARNNLFTVTISGMSESPMLIKTATLPESMLGMIEVPYQNRKLKIPGDRTFQDWSVTIMNDEAYVLRKQLMDWQKDLSGFTNFGSLVPAGSSHKAMEVQPYGRDGEISAAAGAKVILYGWPSSIGSIDLSWDTPDSIQEYTVTFAISWDDGGTGTSVTTLTP